MKTSPEPQEINRVLWPPVEPALWVDSRKESKEAKQLLERSGIPFVCWEASREDTRETIFPRLHIKTGVLFGVDDIRIYLDAYKKNGVQP